MILRLFATLTAIYSTCVCFIVEPVPVIIGCTILAWLSAIVSYLIPIKTEADNGSE